MDFKKFISGVSAMAIAASAVAGLAVTASAAGTTTTLYERGVDTAWSTDDATAWGASELDSTYGLHQTGGNASNQGTLTIAPEANAIINVEAYWVGMSNTGRAFSVGNASYFRFGDIYILQNDQDKASAYSLSTFSKTNYTTFTGPNAYRDYDISTKNWYVIDIEVDTSTNTLNQLTVKSSADLNTNLLELSDVQLTGTDYTTIALGYIKSGGVSTTNNEYLKSLVVTQTTQDVQTTSYTVNYVDENGVALKDSATRTSTVGNVVSALDDDLADITAEGTKYSYNAEKSTSSITLDANADANVIDLVFDTHAAVNVPVTAKAGDETIATDEIATYVGDTYSYGPYAYIEYNGEYYKYDGIAEDGSVPAVTDTAAADSAVTLSYTKADDVVWYTEVDASNYTGGHNPYATPADDSNASGGKNGGSVYSSAGSRINVGTFTAPVDGTYKVSYNALSTPGKTRNCYFAIDSTDTADGILDSCDNGVFKTFEHEVTLTAGEHSVYILSDGSGVGFYTDYMVVELVSSDVEPALTLPDVTVEQVAESTSFDADNAARAYTGTFTVTADNYAVSGVEWTASIGEVKGTATSTFETKISADENSEVGVTVVTGLIIQLDKAESFEGIDVTATAIAAE